MAFYMISEYSAEISQSSVNIVLTPIDIYNKYKTLDHCFWKTEDSFQGLTWLVFYSRNIIHNNTIK